MGDELFDIYNLYNNSKQYSKSDAIALNGIYSNSNLSDDYLDSSWLDVTTTAASTLTSTDWMTMGTIATDYNYYEENNKLHEVLVYLSESDIESIIKRIKERNCPTETISYFLNLLMKKRTFSENFLIEMFDYIDHNLIKKLYASQIKSQEYSELALLLETK